MRSIPLSVQPWRQTHWQKIWHRSSEGEEQAKECAAHCKKHTQQLCRDRELSKHSGERLPNWRSATPDSFRNRLLKGVTTAVRSQDSGAGLLAIAAERLDLIPQQPRTLLITAGESHSESEFQLFELMLPLDRPT